MLSTLLTAGRRALLALAGPGLRLCEKATNPPLQDGTPDLPKTKDKPSDITYRCPCLAVSCPTDVLRRDLIEEAVLDQVCKRVVPHHVLAGQWTIDVVCEEVVHLRSGRCPDSVRLLP